MTGEDLFRHTEKIITPRKQHGRLWLPPSLINHWCLKRSRIIYLILSRFLPGKVRINIAMRCRNNHNYDWGHAWVSYDKKPILEFSQTLKHKNKTEITDTGTIVYWIYD